MCRPFAPVGTLLRHHSVLLGSDPPAGWSCSATHSRGRRQRTHHSGSCLRSQTTVLSYYPHPAEPIAAVQELPLLQQADVWVHPKLPQGGEPELEALESSSQRHGPAAFTMLRTLPPPAQHQEQQGSSGPRQRQWHSVISPPPHPLPYPGSFQDPVKPPRAPPPLGSNPTGTTEAFKSLQPPLSPSPFPTPPHPPPSRAAPLASAHSDALNGAAPDGQQDRVAALGMGGVAALKLTTRIRAAPDWQQLQALLAGTAGTNGVRFSTSRDSKQDYLCCNEATWEI